jgi:hypothetical protein
MFRAILLVLICGNVCFAGDALDEVNACRQKKGLRLFKRDNLLTQAAEACCKYRAKRLMAGHTRNDFNFLPPGGKSDTAGCAVWGKDLDGKYRWGTCCDYYDYTYAGAWCNNSF